MRREIDILLRAHFRGCLIVNQESHALLDEDELFTAHRSNLYQSECDLSLPDRPTEWSGPFPGCMQLGGAMHGSNYHMLGLTAHFAIFHAADSRVSYLGVELVGPGIPVN